MRRERVSFAPFACMLVALAAHGQTREPEDVVAVVLGQEITVADATHSEITGLIGDVLTRRFAEDNGIEPTDEELQAFVAGSLRAQREARLGLERQKVELETTLEGVLSPERRESVQSTLAFSSTRHLDIVSRVSRRLCAGP